MELRRQKENQTVFSLFRSARASCYVSAGKVRLGTAGSPGTLRFRQAEEPSAQLGLERLGPAGSQRALGSFPGSTSGELEMFVELGEKGLQLQPGRGHVKPHLFIQGDKSDVPECFHEMILIGIKWFLPDTT